MLLSVSYGQTKEIIGRAVVESFKNQDDSCFNYFLTTQAFKEAHKKDLGRMEMDVLARRSSWEKLAPLWGVQKKVSTEDELLKEIVITNKEEEHKDWMENIKNCDKCKLYEKQDSDIKIVKDTSDKDEPMMYMAILNSKTPIAIKFSIAESGGKVYLDHILGVFIRNEKGKYACSITCNERGGILKLCDAE